MNATTKLAGFAAVLAVAFGGAAAVGSAFGPIDVGVDATHDVHGPDPVAAAALPRGLAVAQAGYRLVVDEDHIVAGAPTRFGFRIVDVDGVAVTAFDELHERPLHLIVVSRNLVDYLHLHPRMDASGHWSVELPALAPGSYRALADFQPTGGENLTLASDLTVPGELEAVDLPAPAGGATVDGYTVTVAGSPAVGDSELTFEVELDGAVIRTEPYLGAAGHLVAIRDGDLAYLHVHPHEDDTSSRITFTAEFPTGGTYRLFLDFSHDGTVRTASFTVVVEDGRVDTTAAEEEDH